MTPESLPDEQATRLRQARLRLASTPLYPMLPPDEWLGAAEAASRVQAEAVGTGESAPQAMRERILPEEHFEFRGGQAEVTTPHKRNKRSRARTRGTDYPNSPER